MKEEETKDINDDDDELPEYMAENMISVSFGDVAVSIGGDASLGDLRIVYSGLSIDWTGGSAANPVSMSVMWSDSIPFGVRSL